jgi:pyridoxamine 5'-phosphate oxidase
MAETNNFSEETVDADPFFQFRVWYEEHSKYSISIPDAVSLGTASSDGNVSVRTVLLKDYNDHGFVFYTNYKSRKGLQLSANNRAALLFYWPESGRQIRIEGFTEKTSEADSSKYFNSRLRESQLSAWASEQSTVIPDRRYLEKKFDYYKNLFFDKTVSRPDHWGGFRLIPEWFEFWQEGPFRLHDRLTYTKRDNIWVLERLAP